MRKSKLLKDWCHPNKNIQSLACQSSTSNQVGDTFVLLIILISIAITVWALHAFLVCAFVWDTVSASLGLSFSCLRFFVSHLCSKWSGMLCPPPSWSSILSSLWNAWLSARLRSLSPMLRFLGGCFLGLFRGFFQSYIYVGCVQRNRCMTLSSSGGSSNTPSMGALQEIHSHSTARRLRGEKEVSSHCVFRYRRVTLSKRKLIYADIL